MKSFVLHRILSRLRQRIRAACHQRRARRHTETVYAIEQLEFRQLLSASPTIVNNTAATASEGSYPSITGTVSDDGYDMVSVRMSTDGGATWQGPQSVYPSGSFYFMANAQDDGVINYTIEATDTDSNVTSTSGTLTVTNVAPAISVTSPPPSTIHDNEYLMMISGSLMDPGMSDTETLTVNWGDGSTENLSHGPNDSFSLSHQYGVITGSTVTITLGATDDDGGSASSVPYTLTKVAAPGSAPPTIVNNTATTASEGSYPSITGTVSDDGYDMVSMYLSTDGGATWEGPQSVYPSGSFYFMANAQDDGVINYLLKAVDANANVVTTSDSMTVTNVAPTIAVTTPPPTTIYDNEYLMMISGDLIDPGMSDTETLTVNWGDGTTENLSHGPNDSFSLSHQYGVITASTVTIILNVIDDDGGSATSVSYTLTKVAAPGSAPPTIVNNTATTAPEGSYPSITGTVSDDGYDVVHMYVTTDGGTTWQGPLDVYPTGSFFFMTTAPDDGVINYTIKAVDANSNVVTQSGSLTVTNVAPTLTVSSPPPTTIYDNEYLMMISGNLADPGMSDTETLTVSWGDGTTETFSHGPNDSFSLSHQYGLITGPTVTITLSATDDDGGSSGSVSYTLNEVPVPGSDPPTIVDNSQATAPEGSYPNVTGTVSDDISDPVNMYLSTDGGTTWDGPQTVYPTGTFSFMVPAQDNGIINYTIKAVDANTNVVTAPGSLTITNVAPTITVTTDPTGITVHENQMFSLGFDVSDPAGTADPLTVTIDWGAGPSVERYETLTFSGTGPFSVSRMHQYQLSTDQTVTITVTADDDDGGSTLYSSSLIYDDVISNMMGAGVGAVGGLLHFLLHADVDSGQTISSYSVDINYDGIPDVYMIVTADTWDPSNVVVDDIDALGLLGNPTTATSFTARFSVTTVNGITDFADLSLGIDAALIAPPGVTVSPPGAGAASVSITPNLTLRHEESTYQNEFVGVGFVGGVPITQPSVAGIVTLTKNQLAKEFNRKGFALVSGVQVTFGLQRSPGVPAALMPYFIQYRMRTATVTDPNTNTTSTQVQAPWGLDGAVADPNHPQRYVGQSFAFGEANMLDRPGWPLQIPIVNLDKKADFSDPANPKALFKMSLSVADELSRNGEHFQRVLQQEKREWSFETYVAESAGGNITPIGYLKWKFRVTATASGYTIDWIDTPTYIAGDDGNVWNL